VHRDPHSGDPDRQRDCSSLMQQAYAAAGIAIPRITTDQARTSVPVAAPAAARPGDLIVIPGSEGTMSYPRHVGMYPGQGLIIRAPRTGGVGELTRWGHRSRHPYRVAPDAGADPTVVTGWITEVQNHRRKIQQQLTAPHPSRPRP
jgi:hypothetical protein